MTDEALQEANSLQGTGRKKLPTVFLKDGQYGLKKNGTILLPPVYQEIMAITATELQIKQANKYGMANSEGNIFIAAQFDSISNHFIGNGAIIVYKNGKAAVLDTKGQEVLPMVYDAILYSNARSHYSFIKKEDRLFLLYGKEPLQLDYQSLIFYNNLAVIKQNGRYGLLKNGKLTDAPKYDSIYVALQKSYSAITGSSLFSDYRMMATTLFTIQNNQYGLLQNDGGIIAKPQFDNIQYDHYRKVYHLKKDSLTGLYLEATKKISAVEFEQVHSDGMKLITVKKNKQYGILNYQLEQILPCAYDRIDIMNPTNNLRVVQKGKTGLFTDKGKLVIPVQYDTIEYFSLADKLRGLFKVSLNNRRGIVNQDNKIIVPPVYEHISVINNLLEVQSGKKYGLYNRYGKRVCDTVYQGFKQSDTKYSRIFFSYKDSLKGIISDDGMVLYEPVFKSTGYIVNTDGLLNPFNNGKKMYLCVKGINNKAGVFDEAGAQLLLPLEYDAIYQILATSNSTFFSVKKRGKCGVVNDKDSIIIPFEYDSIDLSRANPESPSQLQAVVKKGNLYGAITLFNKIIIPVKYRTLVKLSDDNFYKARMPENKGENASNFILLDDKNNIVNKGPFDDIGLFEGNIALSFYKDKMQLINKSGQLISEAKPMQPHIGYTTFEELKLALIDALNNTDNKGLEIFAYKTAPSWHLLYLIKRNILTGGELGYALPEGIRKKYMDDLSQFKKTKWQTGLYNKNKLSQTDDYTYFDDGLFLNKRLENTDYGDAGFLEKFLGNAVRVNGYWISSYFMNPHYNP